jgi:2-succinyl-5-enolpyruvyl-6-hydroxy-3-cyclohexene-1-carboxylate synthase
MARTRRQNQKFPQYLHTDVRIRNTSLNGLWADLLVEELIRNGVEIFCVAPGSRSSPLALAVADNRRAISVVHADERGLAFCALGHARRTGNPVAVITTSGTAAANCWPAVVEASMDHVPLVVLTADRPPELRATGANQTIDQVNLFGAYARWFIDMPCPDDRIPASMVLSAVDQAVFRAMNSPRGPVHINCMFREPLSPEKDGANPRRVLRGLKVWLRRRAPLTRRPVSKPIAGDPPLAELEDMARGGRRGVIVAGALHSPRDTASVRALARKWRWPLLPDVLSGLRLGRPAPLVVSHADLALLSGGIPPADVVVHVGGRLVSKRMQQYIDRSSPKHYVLCNDNPDRLDPSHRVTLRIQCELDELLRVRVPPAPASWRRLWRAVDADVAGVLNGMDQESADLTEPQVARLVSRLLPAGHALFLGNSMPIRDMSMFAAARGTAPRVVANRGASGIDGCIASAAGFGPPGTAIVGDLAALHDLNSLQLLKTSAGALVLVIVNNDGGGIFSFLPIAGVGAPFEKFFGTPHGRTFERAAAMFDLPYARPETPKQFAAAYRAACASRTPHVIEVRTTRSGNFAAHVALTKAVRRALM